ncbi:cytochrome P450 family protein [Pseudonocardia sp. GCM10023141]|uniref:cytochrome P450 family protein n=1 Tax=Pseudonocardia sp. GCM10023141 TaxID=3252653 RepID=UPI003616B33D
MTTTPSLEPDLMNPALIADPYGGFGQLREEGPVLRGRGMDGSPTWYVSRYDDVRAVLSDPRFVTSATAVPGGAKSDMRETMLEMLGIGPELGIYLTGSILNADGPDHHRLRKLVSRAFTVRRIGELRPRVEAIAASLLDAFTDPTDLVTALDYPLPITVICELVGVPEADRPKWREWGQELMAINPATASGVLRAMADNVQALIEERRARPSDDLLSALIRRHADEDDQLTDIELVTMVFTLVMAGHETTAHLIGNGARALLTHPDQLDLLRVDPSLWPGAVAELMRFCGPVLITGMRYATEDLDVAGVRVEQGDAVQTVLVSANFDPREYDDPQQLDVTRRPSGRGDGHVGFGHGAHYCLGAALARQEGEVALRSLFERYPDLALATAEPEWVPVPGMRRLARLPVRLG